MELQLGVDYPRRWRILSKYEPKNKAGSMHIGASTWSGTIQEDDEYYLNTSLKIKLVPCTLELQLGVDYPRRWWILSKYEPKNKAGSMHIGASPGSGLSKKMMNTI